VYADAPLFEEAELRRAELGDEKFFARLNEQAGRDDGEGWGELAAAWNDQSYEQARNAAVGDPNRGRLGGAIVASLLPGFRDAMRGAATGYVDFDTGLAEFARHAHDRGADALILFLDELILWLGSRIADEAFVEREGQKLIKLIEYTTTRPIPIVSIVHDSGIQVLAVDDLSIGLRGTPGIAALEADGRFVAPKPPACCSQRCCSRWLEVRRLSARSTQTKGLGRAER
jgi:hypothetical protein